MRVLLATDFYPPLVGGVEQHVAMLARELARRGHAVDVATVAGSGADVAPAVEDGVRVHRLAASVARLPGAHREASRPYPPPFPDPELVAGFAQVVRARRPDVVHVHGWVGASVLPAVIAAGRPLVLTLHDYGLVCARKDLLRFGAQVCPGPGPVVCIRCAGRHYGAARGTALVAGTAAWNVAGRARADAVIAVSDAVARWSGMTDRAVVIPNFLPDEPDGAGPSSGAGPASPAAAEPVLFLPDPLPAEPYLLFVGALGGHKGFPQLLDAWTRLAEPRPPLVAIGHRWADTPGVIPDGVLVFHDWPNPAVRHAWAGAMAGAIPSTWREPFGIVALEAMAAGVPVVASRTGGLAGVVRDGETGLLVRPGDVPALAAALGRLVGDPALRARLAAGALAAMSAYRAAAVVPRIEAVYRAAMAAAT